MTRFARKRFNNYSGKNQSTKVLLPEEATPWSEMVQSMQSGATDANNSSSGSLLRPTYLNGYFAKREAEQKEMAEKESVAAEATATDIKKNGAIATAKADETTAAHVQKENKPVVAADARDASATDVEKKKKKKNVKNEPVLTAKTKDVTGAEVEKKKKKKKIAKNEPVAAAKTEDVTGTEVQEKKKKKKNAAIAPATAEDSAEKLEPEDDSEKPFTFLRHYDDGSKVMMGKFDGYSVLPEDAEHLTNLRQELLSRGMPQETVTQVLKLKRREAEKKRKKAVAKVCYRCRQPGHVSSNCPEADEIKEGTYKCFRCGSTEHPLSQCRQKGNADKFDFAQCYVCGESGHIARQCSKNTNGIYPYGGCCDECGEVTHLRRNCPQRQKKNQEHRVFADKRKMGHDDRDVDSLDVKPISELPSSVEPPKKKQKIVKF